MTKYQDGYLWRMTHPIGDFLTWLFGCVIILLFECAKKFSDFRRRIFNIPEKVEVDTDEPFPVPKNP